MCWEPDADFPWTSLALLYQLSDWNQAIEHRCGLWPVGCGCYVSTVTSESVIRELRAFMAERDWQQFHTPENLAKSVSIEAAELLECYQWDADADVEKVTDELADVLTYSLLLADRLELDPEQIIRAKLERTRQKYPVDKARGRSTKYDQL